MKLRLTRFAILLASVVALLRPASATDCATLNYKTHKTPCLCGRVILAVGDIGVEPATFGVDNIFTVELRDKKGEVIEAKRLSYNTDRTFCFNDKPKGRYALAFVLFKKGVPEPAIVFPTKHTANPQKECRVVYVVTPFCPESR